MSRTVGEAPLAVLILDPSGCVLEINREAERLYGWSKQELASKPFTNLVVLKRRAEAQELFERSLRGGPVRDVESLWWTREGEPVPVLVSCSPLVDEMGRLHAVACFQKDIREEKRLERTLTESQERFRLCQMAASYGTWDWDLRANVAYCSDEYFRLHGMEPPATKERSFEEWKASLHPEDADRALATIQRAFDEGEPYDDEYRVVWPDGSHRWLAARGKVVRNSEGAPARMFGINIDVTRRKETELALYESAERMRAILDTAAEGMVTIDVRGVIHDANPAVSEMFGYGPEELVGQDVSLLMPSPHRERHQDYIERYLRTREARVIGVGREVVALRKDGSTFPAELSVSEVDHLGLFTGIMRDISARREAEARETALAQALADAEEKERRKFSAFLHDDLQQLLVAAKIHVALLARAPSEDHLLTVETMLDEALDRTRTLSLELHPPVLEERGLGAAFEWLAKRMQKHHGLHAEVVADHGAGSLRGSDGRLAFALVRELLFNAAKHSRAHRARLEASLEKHPTGQDWLALAVSDEGVGFDPEAQLASPARESLGLASIGERVRLAGGELDLTSEPGRGTRATVRLPLKRA